MLSVNVQAEGTLHAGDTVSLSLTMVEAVRFSESKRAGHFHRKSHPQHLVAEVIMNRLGRERQPQVAPPRCTGARADANKHLPCTARGCTAGTWQLTLASGGLLAQYSKHLFPSWETQAASSSNQKHRRPARISIWLKTSITSQWFSIFL